jgi:superfamily II DNA or RNA helicase
MATGTGKTFTTVSALKRFKETNGKLHCVVGVPLISLLVQWQKELQSAFGNELRIIVASTSVEPDWRKNITDLIVKRALRMDIDFAILVPYVTLSSEELINKIQRFNLQDIVFLADEMHNLVTSRSMNLLDSGIFSYRLGLSATPVRLWAPDESAIVKQFFGDDPYVFTLERAIKEEFLVPFNYYVKPVHLTIEEFEEYCNVSKEIGRYGAMGESYKDPTLNALLKRARIKKNAENKLLALSSVVQDNKTGQNMHHALIYVDNTEMLENVQRMLEGQNISSSKFTGGEDIDRRSEIIDSLRDRNIDAIVAMKCLDEGVDIPSA